jgi:hypothetical protein
MKPLQLTLEDGTSLTAVFRAPKVRQYPSLFTAWEKQDEAAMIEILARNEVDSGPAMPDRKDWAGDLTPESYEEAAAALYQVGDRFFAWCGRRAGSRSILEKCKEVGGRGDGTTTSRTSPSQQGSIR